MKSQIELICKSANCKPENLPNLTTLNAGCNSKITDAGLALINNRKK